MIFVEFEPDHLKLLSIQKGQYEMLPYLEHPEYGDIILRSGGGFSCFEDGNLLGCGGIQAQMNHRGTAWALISSYVKPRHMMTISRHVKSILNQSTYTRIEAIIREGFPPAYRWANLLGFSCDTPSPMINSFSSGESAYLFSMVKK